LQGSLALKVCVPDRFVVLGALVDKIAIKEIPDKKSIIAFWFKKIELSAELASS